MSGSTSSAWWNPMALFGGGSSNSGASGFSAADLNFGLPNGPIGSGAIAPGSLGSMTAPGAPALGQGGIGSFGQTLGWNAGTGQLALGGLQGLGNLWSAYNANSLARDQLNFQKTVTNTNLNNQIKSYNTALEDRARARGATQGDSAQTTQDYISRNSMTR